MGNKNTTYIPFLFYFYYTQTNSIPLPPNQRSESSWHPWDQGAEEHSSLSGVLYAEQCFQEANLAEFEGDTLALQQWSHPNLNTFKAYGLKVQSWGKWIICQWVTALMGSPRIQSALFLNILILLYKRSFTMRRWTIMKNTLWYISSIYLIFLSHVQVSTEGGVAQPLRFGS